MVDWERANPLFKFTQVRAPQRAMNVPAKQLPRIRAYFADDPTVLHATLVNLRGSGDLPGAVAAATRFINDEDRAEWNGAIFGATPPPESPLTALDVHLANAQDAPSPPDLEKAFIRSLPTKDNVIDWQHIDAELYSQWRMLADSIIAVSIAPTAQARDQACLARAMRVACIYRQMIDLGWTAPTRSGDRVATPLEGLLAKGRITETLLDGLILLPADVFPLASTAVPLLDVARRVSGAAPLEEVAPKPDDENLETLARVRVRRAAAEVASAVRGRFRESLGIPAIADVVADLSPDSRDVIDELAIPLNMLVTGALTTMNKLALTMPGATLPVAPSSRVAALETLGTVFELPAEPATWNSWNVHHLTRAPVVGDLHVVRQELLRYEDGEIAHIETVMAHESRVHIHEFNETNETEITTTTDHEEERTHDNQTTDRHEMEHETTNQSQLQANFQAGATVSASFGAVKLDANTQFSVATSSAESNRNASKYSKEVVDHAVERVKERRTEQRRTLTRQQTLERNQHGFDNATDSPVVGIFRWVDKVYEAATFNYGLRMMLDMTVPDPGAYWRYATILAAASSVTAKAPPPLTFIPPGGPPEGRELRAYDIGEIVTVDDLAATYRVGGLKPEPPRWVTTSINLTNEANPSGSEKPNENPALATKAAALSIPKGYTPAWYSASVNLLSNPNQNDWIISDNGNKVKYLKTIGGGANAKADDFVYGPAFDFDIIGLNTLAVGPFIDWLRIGTKTEVTHAFVEAHVDRMVPAGAAGDIGEGGTIPVVLSVIGSPTFAASVTVVCERSDATYKQWQLDQYAAVVTAWEAWNDEFQAAVREAERSAKTLGANSTTMNPLQGSAVIVTELRRMFLDMLGVAELGQGAAWMTAFDVSDPKIPKPPVLKADAAAVAGRVIQFVEQAFDWPELTYFFYPYYWNADTTWPQTMVFEDADPAFGEFLRAGSVRIVVPVRPGFEISVCHHLGVAPPLPWQAGSPPIVDDDPYLSIAEEIKASQTSDIAPTLIDTPWPVRIPTTLIHLQDGAALPVFRTPTPAP